MLYKPTCALCNVVDLCFDKKSVTYLMRWTASYSFLTRYLFIHIGGKMHFFLRVVVDQTPASISSHWSCRDRRLEGWIGYCLNKNEMCLKCPNFKPGVLPGRAADPHLLGMLTHRAVCSWLVQQKVLGCESHVGAQVPRCLFRKLGTLTLQGKEVIKWAVICFMLAKLLQG